MVPSLPIELPQGTQIINVANPMPCAMLRFERPCGNDTRFVLDCPVPARYDTVQHHLIPVCSMCVDEAGGESWLIAVEAKATP